MSCKFFFVFYGATHTIDWKTFYIELVPPKVNPVFHLISMQFLSLTSSSHLVSWAIVVQLVVYIATVKRYFPCTDYSWTVNSNTHNFSIWTRTKTEWNDPANVAQWNCRTHTAYGRCVSCIWLLKFMRGIERNWIWRYRQIYIRTIQWCVPEEARVHHRCTPQHTMISTTTKFKTEMPIPCVNEEEIKRKNCCRKVVLRINSC